MNAPIAIVALVLVLWFVFVVWRNRGPWTPSTERQYSVNDGGTDYTVMQPYLDSDDAHHRGDGHDHGGHHFHGDGHDHGAGADFSDSSDASDGGGSDGGGSD